MTKGSSLFFLLGLFLLGGVYSFWKQKQSKSLIALLAIASAMAIITGLAQSLIGITGSAGIVPMVFALRLLGLASHLGSTMLIWSISGRLQRITGIISPQKRMLAALAFA